MIGRSSLIGIHDLCTRRHRLGAVAIVLVSGLDGFTAVYGWSMRPGLLDRCVARQARPLISAIACRSPSELRPARAGRAAQAGRTGRRGRLVLFSSTVRRPRHLLQIIIVIVTVC